MAQLHIRADLISTVEAATILGRNKATVNRWASDGTLPEAAKAPGMRGARLFLRTDVERLAKDRAADRVDTEAVA